jgi:hypothetical protein
MLLPAPPGFRPGRLDPDLTTLGAGRRCLWGFPGLPFRHADKGLGSPGETRSRASPGQKTSDKTPDICNTGGLIKVAGSRIDGVRRRHKGEHVLPGTAHKRQRTTP